MQILLYPTENSAYPICDSQKGELHETVGRVSSHSS